MIGSSIQEEYERIFGSPTPVCLFGSDEEYESMRHEILNAPREKYNKEKLPFSGISIAPLEERLLYDMASLAEQSGERVFFLKKFDGKKSTCLAAGYYDIKEGDFVGLKGSFFKESEYCSEAYMCLSAKYGWDGSMTVKSGKVFLNENVHFGSASLFASLVLGKQASFREWTDKDGDGLDMFYYRFRYDDIEEDEARAFHHYNGFETDYEKENSSQSVKDNALMNMIDCLTRYESNEEGQKKAIIGSKPNILMTGASMMEKKQEKPEKEDGAVEHRQRVFIDGHDPVRKPKSLVEIMPYHSFMIKVSGVCFAKGWFNPEDSTFTILKGSIVARYEDRDYKGTESSRARKRFISTVCEDIGDYYKVTSDAICPNANAAACYALGRMSDVSRWRDVQGNTIYKVYGKT